ncbi:MAG: sensor histidine kinase N-terminal domain-containing protein [Legionella sp.]|nr:sensor histidine kinase N-terminal domain-containing protein [Legionella sp.]
MKTSIRNFLLINLLLAILLTTTLTAIGNYYLDEKDIHEHLDALMAISTLSYQGLLTDTLHPPHTEAIQRSLEMIPYQIDTYHRQPFSKMLAPKNYLNKFNFQVWSKDNELLLRSPTAPTHSLLGTTNGFSDKVVDSKNWRVFTTTNPKTGMRIAAAEQYDTRNELGHRIAQDDLYIMLLTFPLSGLLIWVIIGRGLASLDRVAQEVANRAPSHLEPVNLEEVPEEIKPVIDELNKLFARLKDGFEREKRFAGDAAHELRTPLAALKAQAQVALNSHDLEAKNRALEKLIVSVNRTAHIIQQLLTMSRLVPESATINDVHKVDIVKLTREVLAMLAPHAVKKNIELEFDYAQSSFNFSANPTALSILIRNLVDNAIRYSYEHGTVSVNIYLKNRELVLDVRDTGPGIPVELQGRVFERFFRVIGHSTQGSGLGLAIVKQIVDLHGGRIELHPQILGSGLIVQIYFPYLPALPPQR